MKTLVSLALLAALGAAPSAQAATYTVTTLADAGPGSLRAAIDGANASAGLDTIRFQNGLSGTITLSSGEIRVSDALAIEGPGQDRLTVAGTASSRVFTLHRAGGTRMTVTLADFTIADGHEADGGAITSTDENLVLHGMRFDGNVAANRGGAIWMAEGDLTIEDSAFTGNAANPSGQGAGGAIHFTAGTVRMERSLVARNSANFGGGVRIASPRANAVIEDSLFLDNVANHTGGGIVAGTMATFRVSRSAFVGNSAGQPLGGAIDYAGATDAGAAAGVVENTTFSANKSLHQAGAASALALESGPLNLRNSTFAFNQTSPDLAPSGDGGTVHVAATNATLTIDSTLFADNTHGNAGLLVDITRPTNGGTSASVLNLSDSLLHTTPAVGVVNGANLRNQFSTDARVQPLTIEPGRNFVPVHPIPADSPAIDAGANPAGLATDQRGAGFVRTIDAEPCRRPLVDRTDVGAYEYRADTIFCHGFEN